MARGIHSVREIGYVTCPFCFASFPPHDILFRCTRGNECPGREIDHIYAAKRNIPTLEAMGHIFEAKPEGKGVSLPFSMLKSARCDKCYNESYTRLCPQCHFELPHDIDQIKQRFIAVIGGTGTGKSHYIGSLVYTLKMNREHNLTVNMMGDSTQERWTNDFYLPVFERRDQLPGTLSASVDTRVKNPLVLRLSSRDAHITRKMHGLWEQAINTSIFDASGEDMAEQISLANENPAIIHAHGLIFVIDPLQLANVQQELHQRGISVGKGDRRSHPDNLLERLVRLFEERGGVRAGTGKISTPTAFVLTKVDVLESIAHAGAAFLRPSRHTNELNLAEIRSVGTDVNAYLKRWLISSFFDTIESRFASYQFFGVSSLGKQPDLRTHLEVVEPLRVEEPFLWLLYQLKFIGGR